MVFIKKGVADFGLVFFRKTQLANSAGGAYLAAQGAVKLAIAKAGNDLWREHALKAATGSVEAIRVSSIFTSSMLPPWGPFLSRIRVVSIIRFDYNFVSGPDKLFHTA